jgi:hypothetical protein
MQTSCTCAGERYHYQVSAQNKSFEDCPISHLRMPTPFHHTMTKKSIKTKSPVADFLTLWRERIQHPLQFHHHCKLLIFLPLPECQLNPTSSAASTTSCLSCLPWPECQIKMSVGVTINHTRREKKRPA